MTVARALLEAADRSTEKRLRVAVDSARAQGLVSDSALRRCAMRLPGHPGAAIILALLGRGVLDKHSEGERVLGGLLEGTTPQPIWQVQVLDRVRLDAARLVLEYDGRDHHTFATDRDHDGLRELRLRAAGIEVIRITAGMIRDHPDETRAMILAVLERRLAMNLRPIIPCR